MFWIKSMIDWTWKVWISKNDVETTASIKKPFTFYNSPVDRSCSPGSGVCRFIMTKRFDHPPIVFPTRSRKPGPNEFQYLFSWHEFPEWPEFWIPSDLAKSWKWGHLRWFIKSNYYWYKPYRQATILLSLQTAKRLQGLHSASVKSELHKLWYHRNL